MSPGAFPRRVLRIRRIILGEPTIRGKRTIPPTPPIVPDRAALEAGVLARYDELMACIAAGHAPEFAAADVTMAQMKALYVIAARGSLHISALAELLGVTLSTGSGVVDRLVDQGLLERRHDDVDRRHVVVRLSEQGAGLLEQLRELSTRRVRSMLGALDDADLAALGRVLTSFIAQVSAQNAAAAPLASQAAQRQEGTR